MVRKEESPPAQAPVQTAPPAPEAKTETKPTEQPKPTEAPAAGTSIRPGEDLALGEQYSKAVTDLMEMGFAKDQVERAMKAAFNNPERAADYLINVHIHFNHRAFLNFLQICQCLCLEHLHHSKEDL